MKGRRLILYVPEFVYGGIDGAVTTFAIVSGALGAALSPSVVLILGFANLFADGFSMAVSNFLSQRSREALERTHTQPAGRYHKHPLFTALATFVSFALVGFIPLCAFVAAPLVGWDNKSAFQVAIALTALAFLVVGFLRGAVTGRNRLLSALVTLVIGAMAAAIAYFVGGFVRSVLG